MLSISLFSILDSYSTLLETLALRDSSSLNLWRSIACKYLIFYLVHQWKSRYTMCIYSDIIHHNTSNTGVFFTIHKSHTNHRSHSEKICSRSVGIERFFYLSLICSSITESCVRYSQVWAVCNKKPSYSLSLQYWFLSSYLSRVKKRFYN